MRPEPVVQIRLGVIAAVLVIACLAVAAFVPDPLFRQRVYETSVDNADGVITGVPVAFMGGEVGQVRWIRLDTARNVYTLGLGLRRDWRPPRCAFVRVSAANPLTAPKVEVAAPGLLGSDSNASCAAFRQASGCTLLPPPTSARVGLDGCLRQGDLVQLAASALAQATGTITEGRLLVTRLEGLAGGLGKPGAKGAGMDFGALAKNVTETTAALDAIAGKVNATLSEERQRDLGAAIGNVRTLTGKAAQFDVASVQSTVSRTNALLEQMTALLKENRESVQALANQGAGLTGDSRDLLGAMQASVVSASGNLERASANLDALSERLRGDPAFALRGARYTDPPAPGSRP